MSLVDNWSSQTAAAVRLLGIKLPLWGIRSKISEYLQNTLIHGESTQMKDSRYNTKQHKTPTGVLCCINKRQSNLHYYNHSTTGHFHRTILKESSLLLMTIARALNFDEWPSHHLNSPNPSQPFTLFHWQKWHRSGTNLLPKQKRTHSFHCKSLK